MRTNSQEAEYARELVPYLAEVERAKAAISDLLASAKDAGCNVKAIRAAAKEKLMDPDKRAKKYEDEDQLDLLRDALGLTGNPVLKQNGFEDRMADDGARVQARARSEASGRERSIMRCDLCESWTNGRCLNGKSGAYRRRTSPTAYCNWFGRLLRQSDNCRNEHVQARR